MPDAAFDDPRLARLYDPLEGQRDDLAVYAAMADELGATTVVDIGCGTGVLACMLAGQGMAVVGVDPAAASLEQARTKPGAHHVRWILGDATALPALQADLALMTGNVAQVFVSDDEWDATLRAVGSALRRGGLLVFETRDPSRQAWLGWTREQSFDRCPVDGLGEVESWVEVTDVDDDRVAFRWTFRLLATDETLVSDSTLRFRSREQLERSLERAGFTVREVRDAPDRPGAEWVFLAERST